MYDVAEEIYREGIERGLQQGTEHIVKTMLKHGFTDEQILLGTGITESRLEEIKREMAELV